MSLDSSRIAHAKLANVSTAALTERVRLTEKVGISSRCEVAGQPALGGLQ